MSELGVVGSRTVAGREGILLPASIVWVYARLARSVPAKIWRARHRRTESSCRTNRTRTPLFISGGGSIGFEPRGKDCERIPRAGPGPQSSRPWPGSARARRATGSIRSAQMRRVAAARRGEEKSPPRRALTNPRASESSRRGTLTVSTTKPDDKRARLPLRPPSTDVDGEPIAADTRKAISLLGYAYGVRRLEFAAR